MPPTSDRRRLLSAVAVVGIAGAVFLYRRPAAAALPSLGETVHDLGVWGPVAVAGVLTLGIPLCLPSSPLLLAAGVLFGPEAASPAPSSATPDDRQWVLAVQWHPELSPASRRERRLFSALVAATGAKQRKGL